MSEQSPCKGCGQPCHQYYAKKYHGYCLNCFNAGRDEADSTIAELRAERDRYREALERLRDGEWGNRHVNGIAREALEAHESARPEPGAGVG